MEHSRDVNSSPDSTRSSRRVSVIVGILSLAVFMSSLDLFIVNLAFPYIGKDFHGSDLSSLSWILNGYSIVFAATLVPAGRWADRIGRRRMFVAGLVVFGIGSLASGFAPNIAMLIGARAVQAVGAGMMVPASLSLLLDVVPPAERARAIGTWSALAALGAALGPVIGGGLVQLSWRWVFWINIPVGITAVVLAYRFLPESSDENVDDKPDLVGAILLAVAVGAVALALVKVPAWGWSSRWFLGLVALSLASVVMVVLRSSRHPVPVVDLTLLQSRTFSGSFVASVFYYGGFGAFVLNTVEFLTGVWHFSAIEAGLAIAPGPLVVLPFARVVAPRLAQRLGGPGRVAVVGCLVNAAAQFIWFTQMQVHSAYASHLLPVQLLGGVGVGLTIPSLLGAGSASIPPARFGTGSGILNMGRQIGTVLGVAALIAILTTAVANNPLPAFRHGVLLITGFFVVAGAVSAVLLRSRTIPARSKVLRATASTSSP